MVHERAPPASEGSRRWPDGANDARAHSATFTGDKRGTSADAHPRKHAEPGMNEDESGTRGPTRKRETPPLAVARGGAFAGLRFADGSVRSRDQGRVGRRSGPASPSHPVGPAEPHDAEGAQRDGRGLGHRHHVARDAEPVPGVQARAIAPYVMGRQGL